MSIFGFSFVSFDINDFLIYLFRRKYFHVKRFLKIFEDHRVSKNEIPEIYPKIDLPTLNNKEKLNNFVDTEKLEDVSDIFKINNSWLRGKSTKIYKTFNCYKFPNKFFEKIKTINCKDTFLPVLIFTSRNKISFESGKYQPLVLVLREKIAKIEGREVFRYFVCGDEWQWNRNKSRIQLKAMLGLTCKRFDVDDRIPIYKIKPKTLKKLIKGQIVPDKPFMKAQKIDIHMEDFFLSKDESACAKEQAELPTVLNIMDEYIKLLDK